jgi:putative SOS response-associated peptidase YedK
MCFNISIAKQKKTLEKRFKADFQEGIQFEPNYFLSAFAKPFVPVITNDKPKEIQLFKWGLIPHWVRSEEQAKDISTKTFNARVETAKEKPSFRDAMKSKHCLVLADGFFEWKTEGKNKIPHYIYQEDIQSFAFAGIWNEWINKESGEIHNTLSI